MSFNVYLFCLPVFAWLLLLSFFAGDHLCKNISKNSTFPNAHYNCSAPGAGLNLLQRYYAQFEPTHMYYNKCNYSFVEICKRNHTNDMIVMNSIFKKGEIYISEDKNSSEATTVLDIISQLPPRPKGVLNFLIVLRFKFGYPKNNTFIPVNISGLTHSVQVSKSDQLQEYMLPPAKHFYNESLPILTVPSHLLNFINQSYMITCTNVHHYSAQCDLLVTKQNTVDCYCTLDHNGVFLVCIVFAGLWTIVVIILLNTVVCEGGAAAAAQPPPQAQSEVQLNMILCNPNRAKYHYLVVFRLGFATDGFPYESAHLDLQLLSESAEPIGQTSRFACRHLSPNRMVSEVLMRIFSVIPLPLVTGVRARHSDPFNLMHFQGFSVFDIQGRSMLIRIQEETIDQFITCESTVFVPLSRLQKLDIEVTKKCTMTSSTSVTKSQSTFWLPLTAETTSMYAPEKLAILVLIFGLVGFATMHSHIELGYYQSWKNFKVSMGWFAFCLSGITSLSMLTIVLLELFYGAFISQGYLAETYFEATHCRRAEGEVTLWYCYRPLRLLYILALYGAGIAFASFTASLADQHRLQYNEVFLWSGMSLSTLSLTVGVWAVVHKCIIAAMMRKRRRLNYVQLLKANKLQSPQSSQHTITTNQSCSPPKIVLPQLQKGVERSKLNSKINSKSSSIGPKLNNPHLQQARKRGKVKSWWIESQKVSGITRQSLKRNRKTSRSKKSLKKTATPSKKLLISPKPTLATHSQMTKTPVKKVVTTKSKTSKGQSKH